MLASVLADRLSRIERDDLRKRRVPAREIVRMFTADHVALHSFGGADKWWNLTMARRGPELKAKDANDTRVWGKAQRIDHKWNTFMRAVMNGRKPPARQSRWSKR